MNRTVIERDDVEGWVTRGVRRSKAVGCFSEIFRRTRTGELILALSDGLFVTIMTIANFLILRQTVTH